MLQHLAAKLAAQCHLYDIFRYGECYGGDAGEGAEYRFEKAADSEDEWRIDASQENLDFWIH
jgi:hypothetical protein